MRENSMSMTNTTRSDVSAAVPVRTTGAGSAIPETIITTAEVEP